MRAYCDFCTCNDGCFWTSCVRLCPQVLLSIQLPFALIPLLQFTSHPNIMGRFLKNSRVVRLIYAFCSLLFIMARIGVFIAFGVGRK